MDPDSDPNETLLEPVVYLVREIHGIWSLSVEADGPPRAVNQFENWDIAFSAAMRVAFMYGASLLVVTPDGGADWFDRLRVKNTAWMWGAAESAGSWQ